MLVTYPFTGSLRTRRRSLRFPRSLLDEYADAADHTRCFLNSGPLSELVFLQDGGKRTILNQTVYEQLVKEAHP
ncbi:MAG: hypothetical protein JWM26_3626 [Betaproteobacteria bacterium]|nr:hypothetical protein [Betaproteobacteria bacterium]